MFQFQPSASEQDFIKARVDAKSTDSPSEQPEVDDVVNVSEDTPANNAVETEARANEEIAPKAEESETAKDLQGQDPEEEGDLFYYDIDGEEVSSEQIRGWKSGSMMQADYTRGKQGVADDRRALDSERQEFNTKYTELDAKLAQLNAMIEEDTPSAEDLAEWREYEPEKLLDYQDKQSKRKDLLEASKGLKPTSNVDAQAEQAKLWQANPAWQDNGKQTQAFTDDMTLTQNYALKNGYSNEELSGLTSAHHFQTLINAAKYEALSKSNASIEKRVRKAPVSTRPKAQTKSHITTDIAAAKAKFQKSGNNSDYVKLRQLERQLNK